MCRLLLPFLLAIAIASSVCLVSCQHTAKTTDTSLSPYVSSGVSTPPKPSFDWKKFSSTGSANVVFDRGDCSSPRYSKQGDRILMICQTLENRYPQIYDYNLVTKGLRQITHQIGSLFQATYIYNDQGILYASSTDEDKENPFIIRSLLHPNTPEEEYANTEIYISRWDGSQIQRLTNHPGFDGYPDLNSKNADIIFTSKRGNEYPLVILNAKNSREYVWSKTKGKNTSPRYSADGREIAWIQQDSQKVFHIWHEANKKSPEEITPFVGEFQDLSWHPDGASLVFSGRTSDSKTWSIYRIFVKNKCVEKLTDDSIDDRSPGVHPDGKSMVFVRVKGMNSAIFSLSLSASACLTAPTASPAP